MKKTLKTVLIFAVVLAVLLGIAALADRLRPEEEAAAAEPTPTPVPEEKVIANEMTPDNATAIMLEGGGASFLGVGASYADGVVTIVYPGTYRISGALDGQIVVDLGDYHGGVYMILDGAEITCADGPALYVKQADLAQLYLSEGTVNRFEDGADYLVEELPEAKTGAAIYSADDLWIDGAGTLVAVGASADGIRSKDTLTIAGLAVLDIYSADDGLQGSDAVDITNSTVKITSGGDGVTTTEGPITIDAGSLILACGSDGVDAAAGVEITESALDITCAGDGVAAAADLEVTGGSLRVTSGGGPDNYASIAVNDLSAKGVKGQNITITGASLELNTADDAIHGFQNVAVTGSLLTIASGDDALSAAQTLEAENCRLGVSECYEGFDAETVALANMTITATAENNALAAGEGGVSAVNCAMALSAPRIVSTEGTMTLYGGSVDAAADGLDSLFSCADAEITGSEILVCAETNDAATLLEKAELPNALLYLFKDAVAAGTEMTIADGNGNEVLSFTRETDIKAVLYTSGALREGVSYTLTAGETALTGTVEEGCVTVEPEGGLVEARTGGFGGFPGMGGFGGRR